VTETRGEQGHQGQHQQKVRVVFPAVGEPNGPIAHRRERASGGEVERQVGEGFRQVPGLDRVHVGVVLAFRVGTTAGMFTAWPIT